MAKELEQDYLIFYFIAHKIESLQCVLAGEQPVCAKVATAGRGPRRGRGGWGGDAVYLREKNEVRWCEIKNGCNQ